MHHLHCGSGKGGDTRKRNTDNRKPEVPTAATLVLVRDGSEHEFCTKSTKILVDMENPRLFSLGRGRYYSDNGVLVLDVGVFTAALEYGADIQTEIIC
jgi:hypothetical protein